jgi:hypothetical protein
MPKCTDGTVEFGRVGRRVVEAAFDGGDIVSDGAVHDPRLRRLVAPTSARRQRLASCLTHRVSVPTRRKSRSDLANQVIASR